MKGATSTNQHRNHQLPTNSASEDEDHQHREEDAPQPPRSSRRHRPSLCLVGIVLVSLTVWGTTQQWTDHGSFLFHIEEEMGREEDAASTMKDTQHQPLLHQEKNHTPLEQCDDDEKSLSPVNDYEPVEEGLEDSDDSIGESSSAGTMTTPAKDVDVDDSQLIDFGIMGFEKCGTTFLLETVFSQSKQVFMAGAEMGREVEVLYPENLEELKSMFRPHVHDTINITTSTGAAARLPVRRGFKNPMVFMNRPFLENLQDNFPTTKFIVTVRHPVLWFQSWYNYKLRTGKNLKYPMPTPHETVGLCREACRHKGPEGQCISVRSPGCSGHSNFHQYLSRMGYTPMDTEEELSLLGHHQMRIFNFSQTKLFLTEIGQMDRKNRTISDGLIRDIELFLDLEEHALPDIEPYQKPDYSWTQDKLEVRIDICDEKYKDILANLLDAGRKAGQWIEDYFLESPKVFVSDRQDLVHRIRQWKVDPCNQ